MNSNDSEFQPFSHFLKYSGSTTKSPLMDPIHLEDLGASSTKPDDHTSTMNLVLNQTLAIQTLSK